MIGVSGTLKQFPDAGICTRLKPTTNKQQKQKTQTWIYLQPQIMIICNTYCKLCKLKNEIHSKEAFPKVSFTICSFASDSPELGSLSLASDVPCLIFLCHYPCLCPFVIVSKPNLLFFVNSCSKCTQLPKSFLPSRVLI